jgi:hypothetical protein
MFSKRSSGKGHMSQTASGPSSSRLSVVCKFKRPRPDRPSTANRKLLSLFLRLSTSDQGPQAGCNAISQKALDVHARLADLAPDIERAFGAARLNPGGDYQWLKL